MAVPIVGRGKLIALGFTALVTACADKPSVNGIWAAELIDGRKVSGDFHILVANGRIKAGNDACNLWGFDDDGSVSSSSIGCPPDTERDREAYWAVVRAVDHLPTPSGDHLVLKGGGHTLIFRAAPVTAADARR